MIELGATIVIIVTLLASWGTMWYKIGKLTSEVKHHNRILTEVQKAIEHIITQ